MRVAVLTNFVPPYRVPVLRALRERLGELRILISTPMESDRPWQPDWSDLDVVVQSTWTLRRTWKHERFRQAYQLHVPYDTIAQLRRWKPDAIITAEFGARTAQTLVYAAIAGVPVIVWATLTEHLEMSRGRARQVLRRAMMRGVDRVITNGNAGARYILSIGGVESRIARIPQAIDLTPFTAIPIVRDAARARRLICVGAVSELKASALLLQAVGAWAERNPAHKLFLTMVGDGPLKPSLQQMSLPANALVEWAGAVPYDALPHWYARSGILVFPTHGDEWGLVVNEAMASGLPVLGSTYSQAVDELVSDGRNGWRFRPDSLNDVVDALARALGTSDAELDTMRYQARETASRITPDSVAGQIAALLHSVRS